MGNAKSNASNKSGKSSGKEGQTPPGTPPQPPSYAVLALTAGTLYSVYYLTSGDSSGREITWQEFRTAFLDKGLVDKLTVVNRTKVRVHLHSNATGVLYPQSPAADGRATYYFSIGSVEAFERKLDDAQNELTIPSSERVPVAYHEEVPLFNTILNFAPTLLLVGFLFWATRRSAGGASGGGGGPFGGGGAGGLFGIGKSRAKMFNVR